MPRGPVGDEEIALTGGDVTVGVVRVGDTVRRPRGPWSDAVASYLRHLERAGFRGAPRYIGVDDRGRDILEYLPGDVPGNPVVEAWASGPDVLVAVARILRRLHEASESFVPPPDALWFGDDVEVELPADLPPLPPADIVSHFDVTPQNVVFQVGRPVAIIDFDLSRPGNRLVDVINTAMWWVPLFPPDDRDPAFRTADVATRLSAFAAAYGLDLAGRRNFVDVALIGTKRSWYRMRANAETRGGGWARMWSEGVGERIRRRERWLAEERLNLASALSGD